MSTFTLYLSTRTVYTYFYLSTLAWCFDQHLSDVLLCGSYMNKKCGPIFLIKFVFSWLFFIDCITLMTCPLELEETFWIFQGPWLYVFKTAIFAIA